MHGPLEFLYLYWTRVLIITSLLLVQGQHASDVTIQVLLGTTFRYRIVNETLSEGDVCKVMTPSSNGFFTELLPNFDENLLGQRIQNYSGPALNQTNMPLRCGIHVSDFTEDDIGNWTLFINRSTGRNVTERFTVTKSDSPVVTDAVVPKQKVTIIEGQNLHLRFASGTVRNVVECSVNWTNGREVILEPGTSVDPLVEYWGSGFNEDCGVKATKIAVDDSGTWTLQVRNASGGIIQGVFNVDVIKPTDFKNSSETVVSGNYAHLSLGADNSKYCLWKSPMSELEEPSAKPCDITINSVTKSSGGNWSARFAVPGQLNEIETTTLVTVKDAETIHTTITPSTRYKGGLDLLCRWTTYKYASNTANFCRFVRPDGVAFSLEDGIGNEKYSYFGEGINYSVNIKDCGITIRSPKTEDEGTWQCVISGTLNEIKGSFINVPSIRRTKELDLNVSTRNVSRSEAISVSGEESEVLVENGKDVTFGCRATASLNYCWFKHPNGTVVVPSLDKKASKSSSVSYAGLGLALGDCRITVTEANLQDSGEWTCNMGIQGEADRKISIDVRVSDGNIVSKSPQIEIKTGDWVELGCKTVPVGKALAYCRFVRPDGISFGFTTNEDEVMSRYRYNGAGLEKGACGVAIQPVHSEDFGKWDCYALHALSSVEGKASINLIDGRGLSGGAVAGIVIGGVVMAAMTLGGILYANYYRRRRFSGSELGSLNPSSSR